MAQKRNGNDFTSGTRTVLAKRVGYKCSCCGKSTLTLHSDPNKAIDIGEAAHICAASPGGPRYDETMTSDQIKNASNGIFLCSDCHTIIDRDPKAYPVEKLKKMKTDAEKKNSFHFVNTKFDYNQREARSRYYELAIEDFEEKKNDFISDESLKKSYIMPMIGDKSLLDLVWEWYDSTPYGVLLLYGQPGHGKTTICQKAVYDYAKYTENAADEALVLQFPLNQAKSKLIDNFDQGTIKLSNVFLQEGQDVPYITLNDCKDKLIFLDGYDEVKYLLSQHTRYKTFKDFVGDQKTSGTLQNLARLYKIHFVITSRLNALAKEDIFSATSIEFPKLTSKQQKVWCARRKNYKKRWNKTLSSVCTNDQAEGTTKDLKELLQIPYIFRMVVHHDYQISEGISNRAALYKDLFDQTIGRNDLHVEKNLEHPVSPEQLSQGYQNLAYKIWCDDENSAQDIENKDILMLAYYIKEDSTHGRYSFIHKSFYDYFMALYLYERIRKCAGASQAVCEEFLSKLAERRINEDIQNLFEEMIRNSTGEEILLLGANALLKSLNANDAIGIDSKKEEKIIGTSEKLRFDRCNNIFVNAISLSVLAGAKDLNKYGNIVRLLRKYDCENVILCNVNLSRAHFRGANFSRADLRGAYFGEANLSRANLSRADLSGADLSGADLREADLNGANLSRADLSGAHLEEADLREAKLSGANLSRANLSKADLNGANLREADLINTVLFKANLTKADFNGANLSRADLNGADLYGVDLNGADLNGADLRETDLNGANLREADLRGVDLNGANLSRADLKEADLYGANLRFVKLSGAGLSGADLRETDLNGANLLGATLLGANLSGANISISNKGYLKSLHGVDTSNVIWCDDKTGEPIE